MKLLDEGRLLRRFGEFARSLLKVIYPANVAYSGESESTRTTYRNLINFLTGAGLYM